MPDTMRESVQVAGSARAAVRLRHTAGQWLAHISGRCIACWTGLNGAGTKILDHTGRLLTRRSPNPLDRLYSIPSIEQTATRKTVMQVFSLVSSVQYQGFELIGVFASREDALECALEKNDDFRYVDSVGVVVSELGKELDMYADVEWFDMSIFGF